ncbi:hypothetical protein COX24_02495 [bacterium (Candidatus Gribaldobacteria) CG23_combo_of_CG06-09_8_20_14_all_37_87_8]|uniref:DUF11 domain-containing protein n=1 Tax=bacterium (Candidatus Gribaldobacteria) CG23_combo_of_CG06-09_8_20_14_all_37_87_8 TaxID=2014278 RepID=A0A2G9ZEP0_9BACT|nr:MAG: hypothetical protein AUJ25_00835 [Parcubacteria group bacterium CG1_02_37_13]PIP31634.1 MAG: hypothetical protein COX24_02495 [bacterium (Candidatus Gribaldobacteria) CG23_combo_of_CG06-09_8_20_14_all_37_87_8]
MKINKKNQKTIQSEKTGVAKFLLLGAFVFSLSAMPFVAIATAPVVLTYNASEVTFNTAKINGEITDHGRYDTGYYNQSQIWFEYGKTVAYGSKTPSRTIVSINSFTESLTGLSNCSIYHFRAVAQNGSATAYGVDKVFTTNCQVQTKVIATSQNITKGGAYAQKTTVDEGDEVSIQVVVESTGAATAKNVSLKVILPKGIVYNNGLTIAGVSDGRNITQETISLGALEPNKSKTIIFKAKAGPALNLPTGLNTLIGTALVYTTDSANTASFSFSQQGTGTGTAVASGIQPTSVNTGIVSDLAFSVLIPLLFAFLIIFLFKSKLIGLDKVLVERKENVDNFRAHKQLKKAIKKRTD